MFLCEKTHRYLKNDYQFFDALKTKDRKIRGNCNLLTKVKFHELEWSSPLILLVWWHGMISFVFRLIIKCLSIMVIWDLFAIS